MKIWCLGVFLVLASGTISCTGGRLGFSRDGYCFNDRDGTNDSTYDPIPLELDDRNYRKATFAPDLPIPPQDPSSESGLDFSNKGPDGTEVEWLTFFASSRYGHGDLNDRIEEVKKREKENAEKWRRELAKIYPLSTGEYQYVGAEIYTTESLPQVVSKNKDRRIYISHLKNKEGQFVFANNCVSNMPKSGTLPPTTVESLTGFSVVGGEVLSDSTSSYRIELEDFRIKTSYNSNDKPALASPKEFLGKSEVVYQLYKLVDTATLNYTHELRTFQEQGPIKIYTRTFYKLVPFETKSETGTDGAEVSDAHTTENN